MQRIPDRSARVRARAALAAISDAEDAEIGAGIAADPDSPELTDEDFSRALPAAVAAPAEVAAYARSRGRPPKEAPKVPTMLRLDPEVVAHFRATGPGWQSRINELLRKAAGV